MLVVLLLAAFSVDLTESISTDREVRIAKIGRDYRKESSLRASEKEDTFIVVNEESIVFFKTLKFILYCCFWMIALLVFRALLHDVLRAGKVIYLFYTAPRFDYHV